MFPKIGVPRTGWFTMENPIKIDDLGYPLWLETPQIEVNINKHIFENQRLYCFKLGFHLLHLLSSDHWNQPTNQHVKSTWPTSFIRCRRCSQRSASFRNRPLNSWPQPTKAPKARRLNPRGAKAAKQKILGHLHFYGKACILYSWWFFTNPFEEYAHQNWIMKP